MRKIASAVMATILSLGCISAFPACSEDAGEVNAVYYTVTSQSGAGGSISSNTASVAAGNAVTFTLTTDSGYALKSFSINGGEVVPTVASEQDGVTVYVYTVKNALRNYSANAVFVPTNATVTFQGEGVVGIDNKSVVYGGRYGELPVPEYAGKRFAGWKDERGQIVNQASVVDIYGDITLTATWADITAEEKALLVPFSATTTYFDAQATSYGVVWHTAMKPISPAVQIVEGNGADFSAARTLAGDAEEWLLGEYTVNAVVDGLDYGKEYSVRFGDKSADVWSKTYTFTTRAEQIDVAKFFYVADTQEERLIANRADGIKLAVEDTYWSQVMREATARFPDADFITHGGDIVNYGAAPAYWREMLDSIDEYLFNLPTQVVAGNHEDPDWYTAGYETVNKLFRVNAPEDDNIRGDYYSFEYGPMHFVCLRSNDVFSSQGKLGDRQVAWLKADVEKARENPNIKWVVAMMHEGPIVPTFRGNNSNAHQPTMGPQMIPVFDELNVDLVLYGHNHYLDSTYPLVWDETQESNTQFFNNRDWGALPSGVTSALGDRNQDGDKITVAGGDGNRVRAVTKNTVKTAHDGVEVDKFVYTGSEAKRGTVYHQTGTAGHQVDTTFALNGFGSAEVSVNNTLAQNIVWGKYYRSLLSGCEKRFDDKNRYMYSYIEVDADKLVVRTYGVDVKGLATATDNLTSYGVYMDGFMLEK